MVIRAALDARGLPIDWRAEDEVTVSPFKIREIHAWLAHLDIHRHGAWSAEQTKVELVTLRGVHRHNRWWQFLDEIWSEWAGSIGESEVPVFSIRETFADAIVERRRTNRTGDGVVLATAHKAKGLEFQHVFIADGGWKAGANREAMEEERRTYYVAMTRARETLTLLCRRDRQNPFVSEISGEHVIDRAVRRDSHVVEHEEFLLRRYATLTPSDVFISYAATCSEASAARSALRKAQVDDPVSLVANGRHLQIETQAGIPIGQLSARGQQTWTPNLERVLSAKLVALVHRRSDEGQDTPPSQGTITHWEYPLVEVCWTDDGHRCSPDRAGA
jgi:ATP-dependent DNA helicase RecQ